MNCRSLRYEYDPDGGVCRFEDGTTYTVREMIFIAKSDLSPETENAIHNVKKVFGGELDTSRQFPYVEDWLSKMGRSFKPAKRVTVRGPLPPLQLKLDL